MTEYRHKAIPRFLYHGTSHHNYIAAMQRGGLVPRKFLNGKSNWTETIESNPNAIYLTTAYPLHFSCHATDADVGDSVIIEVDTSLLAPSGFVADEDAIEQASRKFDKLPKGWNMERRTRYYRDRVHRYDAVVSLNILGTCAYTGNIPALFFNRVAVLTAEQRVRLVMEAGMDPSISVMHFQILGKVYEHNVRWIFGDVPHQSFYTPVEGQPQPPTPDRSDIKIITNPLQEAA